MDVSRFDSVLKKLTPPTRDYFDDDASVSYLREELARRGHRVIVVSTCGPEMAPYPTEMCNGVEVIRFFPSNLYWSFTRSREPGVKKLLWHARDAWNRQAGLARRFTVERITDTYEAHHAASLQAARPMTPGCNPP